MTPRRPPCPVAPPPGRPPAARRAVPRAAALAAAAALAVAPGAARAASCCGGGGSSATILPRGALWLFDLSADLERYDGFWDGEGIHLQDPAGTRLQQRRATLSVAARPLRRWQLGASASYVWNVNVYPATSSRTNGLGDATVALWWEALDEKTAWRMVSARDLAPNVTVGASLTIPTGISPYDDVETSYDVTGRGFYRLDGNVALDKGYRNWSASVLASYGVHLARPVNRSYGKYVEPFDRRLGNRASASVSLSYRHVLSSAGHGLTGNLGFSWLHEAEGVTDGVPDGTFTMERTALTAGLAYASTDHPWSFRASLSHAIQADGWGENFPTTDILTLGARYAY
jgi:hypothetical protein